MASGDDPLAVVIAPETAEEASRHFSALLAGGYHPIIDYGSGGQPLANFPVLVPQQELGEARAFLKGVGAGQPPKPAGVFGSGASDRPVGPIPPWKFKDTVGKALGVLGAMLVLAGAVVALVYVLQFLTSLRGR